MSVYSFCFNDTATTEIYTLSLHDALPISLRVVHKPCPAATTGGGLGTPRPAPSTPSLPIVDVRGEAGAGRGQQGQTPLAADRKSTRLNSSHANISYAVFCLKKKKTDNSPN